jgi:hypothetical protein
MSKTLVALRGKHPIEVFIQGAVASQEGRASVRSSCGTREICVPSCAMLMCYNQRESP